MKASERRQLARVNHRTPLRFRAVGVASDKTEHFTEALNVSRGGFFFASSAPLQVGMPIEATIRMPAEVTGSGAQEMRCTARVVHVRNEPYGDGRIGFGVEIEKYQTVAVDAFGPSGLCYFSAICGSIFSKVRSNDPGLWLWIMALDSER